MTTATYTLARATESGSYLHRITFAPTVGMVRITETMWDDLMGDWLGDSANRMVGLAEARAYYRDRKAYGYKAN